MNTFTLNSSAMKIILSQRIDFSSDYDDIPFSVYHFPKRYRNQIHPGDRFIYYQGDRHQKKHRYYFGCGVIGSIEAAESYDHFYAQILEGTKFSNTVPINLPSGLGFLESLGYEQVRNRPNPPWQSSIRKVSDEAFSEILRLGLNTPNYGTEASSLESQADIMATLKLLNARYAATVPDKRGRLVQRLLDRGSGVTNALKAILGATCQICGWKGFRKKNEDRCFIEAHHLVQVADLQEGSLCTENIILVCPNCHREIHYGDSFSVTIQGEFLEISLSGHHTRIRRNTIQLLEEKFQDQPKKTMSFS